MKITFGRIFEQSLIAGTKAFDELRPFLEWVQQVIDTLARAMTNGITFADNIDAQWSTQTLKSQTTAASVEFRTRKRPLALLVASQSPTSNPVVTFTWDILANSNVQANFVFSAAPTDGVNITFLAIFG